ncbi:hypothetical protein ATANTOWER_027395 [Ataeniobius toweri]|uniref:Uncharacterized protein n=1 Tax=Ataeniobius toweri TaxID=208326 RepID=A0ABU7AZW5_9TELE|nr:hypothetical protein [Ataeniobius toweri]
MAKRSLNISSFFLSVATGTMLHRNLQTGGYDPPRVELSNVPLIGYRPLSPDGGTSSSQSGIIIIIIIFQPCSLINQALKLFPVLIFIITIFSRDDCKAQFLSAHCVGAALFSGLQHLPGLCVST